MRDTINTSTDRFAAINENTTLRELLDFLNLGEKPHETPTPKFLRENTGEPIAKADGCLVYANGYALYDNGSGRTVVWLPDCVSFTYYFIQPKETEIGIVPAREMLPGGLLESQPWVIPVTLVGDHRVEANLMNRMGSRTGTTDFDSADNGDKDGDAEAAVEKSYRNAFSWREGYIGENPEDAYIRRETLCEMLDRMSEKQRRAFTLYYENGFKQVEVARMMGISQAAVKHLLDKALQHARKFF